MTTTRDVIGYIESLTGHPLNRDEGVQHGDAQRGIRAAMICWMATADAIAAAGERRVDLLIGHESLYFPYDAIHRTDNPPGWESWQINRQRRALLDAHALTFARVHGSADEICILDDFATLLGLGAPVVADKLVKVFEIAPCPLDELVTHVKERIGMAHVRLAAAGSMQQPVHRVGLPWGGLGLFVNVTYQQRLIELGCDVMIAGESDNYGFRFAAECGIPMIETSHETSENPGLRHLTQILAAAFPDVHWSFYENPCIWQWA